MVTVKDYETGKELKFENPPNEVTLICVGINFVGDKVIYGTVDKGKKTYHAEWELDGELYRAHNDLENTIQLSLTPIIELKPCPFCGSEDLTLRKTADIGHWYIDCNCCKVFLNTYLKEKKDAILKWNRRCG